MAEPHEQSTRREILHFIKRHGAAEPRVLAESCGLTTMAVRRHLLKLRAEGLIQPRTERRPKGRPATLYSLTELGDAEFPREYDRLAYDSLTCLKVLDGEAKVKRVFRQRRVGMTARYAPRMNGKNLEQRVRETAAILSECGYMAVVARSGPRAFLLTEHNCAIPRVAECFPVACEEELHLIRELVGAQVTRVSHRLAGDCHCSYLIRSPSATSASRPAPPKVSSL